MCRTLVSRQPSSKQEANKHRELTVTTIYTDGKHKYQHNYQCLVSQSTHQNWARLFAAACTSTTAPWTNRTVRMTLVPLPCAGCHGSRFKSTASHELLEASSTIAKARSTGEYVSAAEAPDQRTSHNAPQQQHQPRPHKRITSLAGIILGGPKRYPRKSVQYSGGGSSGIASGSLGHG